MTRKFWLYWLAITLLICALPMANAQNKSFNKNDFVGIMHAMWLATNNEYESSAALFAELAEKLQDADLMREAYRNATLSDDKQQEKALIYAKKWQTLGGGTPALQAQAHLLLTQEKWEEAESILRQLKSQQSDIELFQFLQYAKNQKIQLGKKLFDDNVDGDILLARLALADQNWDVAQLAIKNGIARNERLDEFYMLRMLVAHSIHQQYADILAIVEEYLNAECPQFIGACREHNIIYAFLLFSDNDKEWRKKSAEEDNIDAILKTGNLFEQTDMLSRALPYYTRIQDQSFQARLGLARIWRDREQLQKALDILNNTKVDNETEFALREVTASDITEKLSGAPAALERIARAHVTAPDNHDLIYHHSLMAEKVGDIELAIELLESLTNLYPRSAQAWNGLGYLLADHNIRLSEAEQYIRKALQINPVAAHILDSLGWVYYRQGRLQEAHKYLQQAAAGSDHAEIAAHLAEVKWILGKREQAQAILKQARLKYPDNHVLNDTIQRLGIFQ